MDDNITRIEIEDECAWVFFGPNANYYLERWQLRQQGKYVTFNVAAFFGGLFWFAYRRMYLVLFFIFVALILETLVEQALIGEQQSTRATVLANLVFASLYGAFGNSLYLWDAERKMRKIVRLGLPREELLARLRRAGGASWWFVPVVLVLAAVFVGLYVWAEQQAGQ